MFKSATKKNPPFSYLNNLRCHRLVFGVFQYRFIHFETKTFSELGSYRIYKRFQCRTLSSCFAHNGNDETENSQYAHRITKSLIWKSPIYCCTHQVEICILLWVVKFTVHSHFVFVLTSTNSPNPNSCCSNTDNNEIPPFSSPPVHQFDRKTRHKPLN